MRHGPGTLAAEWTSNSASASRAISSSRTAPSASATSACGLLDDAPGLTWEFLADDAPRAAPDQVRDYDALLVLAPRVTAATLAGVDRLASSPASASATTASTWTPAREHGVAADDHARRRPPPGRAVAVLTFLLALSHKLLDQGPPHPRGPLGREAATTWARASPAGRSARRLRQHRPRRLRAGHAARACASSPTTPTSTRAGAAARRRAGRPGDAAARGGLRLGQLRARRRRRTT